MLDGSCGPSHSPNPDRLGMTAPQRKRQRALCPSWFRPVGRVGGVPPCLLAARSHHPSGISCPHGPLSRQWPSGCNCPAARWGCGLCLAGAARRSRLSHTTPHTSLCLSGAAGQGLDGSGSAGFRTRPAPRPSYPAERGRRHAFLSDLRPRVDEGRWRIARIRSTESLRSGMRSLCSPGNGSLALESARRSASVSSHGSTLKTDTLCFSGRLAVI